MKSRQILSSPSSLILIFLFLYRNSIAYGFITRSKLQVTSHTPIIFSKIEIGKGLQQVIKKKQKRIRDSGTSNSFNQRTLATLDKNNQGDEESLGDDNREPNGVKERKSGVEEEMERLQQLMMLIEALEERNKAQLDSFIDKEDQWNSLEEFERELLESKESIVAQMEKLTEELLQLWMGAKSMDG